MTDRVFRDAKATADRFAAKAINDRGGKFGHAPTMTNSLSFVKATDEAYSQLFCHGIRLAMEDVERPFADIAARLKWHRALEGLDQEAYARRAGLKRAQLNNWENGNFRLSVDGALALRRTYGLSLDFMYEGIDDALPMTLRQAWRDRPAVSASKKSIVNPDA